MTDQQGFSKAFATLTRLRSLAPAMFLVLLLVPSLLYRPDLANAANLFAVLLQSVPTFIIGLSVSVLLIAGVIDLSAGLIVAFISVVMGYALASGLPTWSAMGLGLIGAIAVGIWNGALVTMLRVPAFIATLATAIILQGVNLLLSKGIFIVRAPEFKALGRGEFVLIPNQLLIGAGIAVIGIVVLRHTRFGLKTYAIGSDPESAKLSGINVPLQQFWLFLVASVICFSASVVLVSRSMVVTTNVGGMPLLLDGIAAAVIGGVSIFGGKGRVGGVIWGAITIALLTHLLRVLGVSPTSFDVFKGLLIGLALLVDAGWQRTRVSKHA